MSERARQASPSGPHDADDPSAPRWPDAQDFGSLLLRVPEGSEPRIIGQPGSASHALTLRLPAGQVSLSAVAAPSSSKLWPELADAIARAHSDEGAVLVQPGEWGPEVQAGSGNELSWFIGVDGVRWMLYGVATGPASRSAELAAALRELLRGCVVRRGLESQPARTPLRLRMPDQPPAHAATEPPASPPRGTGADAGPLSGAGAAGLGLGAAGLGSGAAALGSEIAAAPGSGASAASGSRTSAAPGSGASTGPGSGAPAADLGSGTAAEPDSGAAGSGSGTAAGAGPGTAAQPDRPDQPSGLPRHRLEPNAARWHPSYHGMPANPPADDPKAGPRHAQLGEGGWPEWLDDPFAPEHVGPGQRHAPGDERGAAVPGPPSVGTSPAATRGEVHTGVLVAAAALVLLIGGVGTLAVIRAAEPVSPKATSAQSSQPSDAGADTRAESPDGRPAEPPGGSLGTAPDGRPAEPPGGSPGELPGGSLGAAPGGRPGALPGRTPGAAPGGPAAGPLGVPDLIPRSPGARPDSEPGAASAARPGSRSSAAGAGPAEHRTTRREARPRRLIPHGAQAARPDRGSSSTSKRPDSDAGSRHSGRSGGHSGSHGEPDRSPLRTRHDDRDERPDGLPGEQAPGSPLGLLDGALGLVLGCDRGCS
ncbi:MAG TPA: DUF3710 domain-containing protein [Pseudonocardia sp.]